MWSIVHNRLDFLLFTSAFPLFYYDKDEELKNENLNINIWNGSLLIIKQ